MELFSDQSVIFEVAAFKIFYYDNENQNGVKHLPKLQPRLGDHVHLWYQGDPECQVDQEDPEDLGFQGVPK